MKSKMASSSSSPPFSTPPPRTSLYPRTAKIRSLMVTKTCTTKGHPPSSAPIHLPLRSPNKLAARPLELQTPPPQTNPSTVHPHPASESCKTPTQEKKNNASSATTDVLRLLDGLGVTVSPDIYVSLIKECTANGDSAGALELHKHIRRSGLRPSLHLLNRVLLMYAVCGYLVSARKVFEGMLQRDFSSWAILTVSHVEEGEYEEAIGLFLRMLCCINVSEIQPWIVVCILKACVRSANKDLGEQVHGWLLKQGSGGENPLPRSLIDFYGKFNCPECANIIFQQLPSHNSAIWTAKLAYDCSGHQYDMVFSNFREIDRAGIRKSRSMFLSVLKACGRVKDDRKCGQQVHAKAIKVGVESDAFVQSGLVDMYGQLGLLRDARTVFDMVRNKKSTAFWNAMIKGYIKHGLSVEAIKLLYQMKEAGLILREDILDEVRIASGS
ncbi:pentatricopeptide repeat-containing protein At1g31790 [Rhodamnia argentea]|uniref:Pentatricopeptide repeat-containing protein At1g31790 n=1 Tax=Rhodamnia argentea TaxID=178133 RepID=A0A8B8R141_9MYRT|nr:pentatricopeptide repeat-containing protein At1g31790 [Rhodamnia argentea]XP_030552309.2 pentatricopeptide repeat-containing protein At1g31790 [Rhodamnia argentea]XP_048141704.1 pentatricopeptide repeat-containing protein At1g31790 [Rhodamnia argentea]XP_048141705.1 pentatricopeptide repeat-containing protein At1g31790 [Rhodamnia argentea]XP_048141707.1 pentatricopeptide repeat-containing protein At1g31790 [Rhodamnia argentea]